MRVIKINIFVVLTLLMSVLAQANNPDALRDSAELYYKNAQYQSAIDCYEQILKTDLESANLYFNLGNAHFKKNELALAIVNYERALKLSPNDEDIQFNLKMAKSQTIDKIETLPVFFLSKWIDAFVSLFSSNTWAYLSIVFFILALILLLRFFFSQSIKLKKISFYSGIILLIFSTLSIYSAHRSKVQDFDKAYVIVSNPSVNIKSSPDDNSTSLFILHTGTKLEILDHIQDWYKIKIENGNVGWIKKADVLKI